MLHNLKFGALDRYGLGGADLVAAKPSLVFCNLGAFGATGPLRDKPGYDPMMQAYSGLMSLLGEDGRPPVRVPASIIDMGAGMWSVIGILSALQERGRTGKGGVVDTSLYETGLAWMSIYLAGYLANRELPARHGSGVDMIVPYQAFAAADGYMMVAAGNDNLFRRLAAVLDRPGLAEDPRFHSNKDRVVNRKELVPILSDIFATKPRAEWARLLDAQGIPNGPINTLDQVVADAQTQALGIIQTEARQRTRPCRPAAVVRRGAAGIREGGAGARRRQSEARPMTRCTRAVALLLLAALAGCGGMAGGPPGGAAARRSPADRDRGLDRAGRPVHRLDRAAAAARRAVSRRLRHEFLYAAHAGSTAQAARPCISFMSPTAMPGRRATGMRRATRRAARCALSRSAETRSPVSRTAPMPRNSPPRSPRRNCATRPAG